MSPGFRNHLRNILLLLLFFLAVLSCEKKDVNDDREVTAWLQDHAVVLKDADPATADTSLNALKRVIGDARIVGLGEGTHGTTEFWGIRQKISRYLVEEMGFTAILMEAGFPNGIYVNRYITTGEGTAEEAHRQLTVWRYREMRDLIGWMRDHNLQHGEGSLQYYGYDCAFRYWTQAIELITAYLQVVDPAAAGGITAQLNNYTPEDAGNVYQHFLSHAGEYTGASSPEEYGLMLRITENLGPSWQVWYNLLHGLPDLGIRDEFNLSNLNWIINRLPGEAKVIIWAHNGHVGNTWLPDNGSEAKMLGARIREQYGNDYYVIATEFYGGRFLAWDRCEGHEYLFVEHQAALPEKDYYAYKMHLPDIPLFFLDLRHADLSGKGGSWLNGPLQMRFIGASYCAANDREYYSREMSLTDEYDAVICFETTSPTEPVTFGR